ncbi:cytochrome c3 family protein [Novosphingobium sp. B 225]|uniref:cytochrome c3 family protein n=1 Tax=Novosphingobium sp. B 225 TaxID=1961849 RepID=UPI000B4BAD92|nr:cytochrome c3 family protein [Novosphingobium sp. B 225]
MIFRIRTIEQTAAGREIVRDRDVVADSIRVGRDSACEIDLADLGVDPAHARIADVGGGRVSIAALGTLGFALDGRSTTSATIDPATGAELKFGSTRIALTRDGDALLLTIHPQDADPGAALFDEKRSFTLAGILPGRRALAWILALAVLASFLLVPIYNNLTREPGPKATVMGDGSWTPGPLSKAHHGLEGQCTACHVKPFESVRDDSCKSCHKDSHDHAQAVRLAGARGDLPLGRTFLWKVAGMFGKPGPGACVDCHREHEGAGPMQPAQQQFCSDCHSSLSKRLHDTKLGDAGDFGTLHPQFKALIVTDSNRKELTPISLDANPQENNGLVFSHRVHLDPRGGVAKMAMTLGSYGKAGLDCQNCHRKDEQGVRFRAINMERDCQSCHSLVYDKFGGTFRTLHHGDVNQTVADLRTATPRAPMVVPMLPGRSLPGNLGGGFQAPANPRPPLSLDPVQRAFGRGGVCSECHLPAVTGFGGVKPVRLTQRYFAKGWFDHRSHRQTKCSDCHAAGASRSSSDVLMPELKQCRTCHLGEAAHKAKVPSSCAMCHSYHDAALPRRTERQDRKTDDDKT